MAGVCEHYWRITGHHLVGRHPSPVGVHSHALKHLIERWGGEPRLAVEPPVDRRAGTIRIVRGMAKGGEPRTVILRGELREVIDKQWDKHRLDCPYVFHRAGKRIKDFRGSWE
jgi:hypothetical protein